MSEDLVPTLAELVNTWQERCAKQSAELTALRAENERLRAQLRKEGEDDSAPIDEEWLRSFRDYNGKQLFGETEDGVFCCSGLWLVNWGDGGGWRVQIGGTENIGPFDCDSLEAAQSAAWLDFVERMRPAFVSRDSSVLPPVPPKRKI